MVCYGCQRDANKTDNARWPFVTVPGCLLTEDETDHRFFCSSDLLVSAQYTNVLTRNDVQISRMN